MALYFEDIPVGVTHELGSTLFTEAAIIAFARRFDPQPFHLDPEAGRRSLFGALAASGWHTASVWLRHMVDRDHRIADEMRFRGERPARMGPSPGFERLAWPKPVLAGTIVRYTTRVADKVESRSRPEVGLILSHNEGHDQAGDLVFSVTGKIFVERREPGIASGAPEKASADRDR